MLSKILPKQLISKQYGNAEIEISGITLDSREVRNDFLFAALPGTQVDGFNFIDKAISQGAKAILCEKLPEVLHENVCYLLCLNGALTLGHISSAYYDFPSKVLKVVAVTGTNGKTSVTTLLKNAITQLGYKVGLLSTVQNMVDQEIIPATHTTPNAVAIQALLSYMVEQGCDYVFMEASSHASTRRSSISVRSAISTSRANIPASPPRR